MECLTCHINTKNSKYCSLSCAAKVNNLGRNRYAKWTKKECTFCLMCGDRILTRAPKFCSNKCSGLYRRMGPINQWLKGEISGSGSNGNLRFSMRRFLLEQNKYKCSLCGWGETNMTSGTIPLEIDHIDGNWNNNSCINLKVLCPNCHSLTPTYKALNKHTNKVYKRPTRIRRI